MRTWVTAAASLAIGWWLADLFLAWMHRRWP
jgi:hypothetical protein